MTWKQPHEGITGTDRDSFLLSLDEEAVEHRDALIAMARLLRDACGVGNPAPIVERMGERLRNPRPGDLVVEASRVIYGRVDTNTRVKGFGILVERRREWWETDKEWEELKTEDDCLTEDDRRTDNAWYIQYGNSAKDICRWVNCDFVVLPVHDDVGLRLGKRDGNSVTLDRGDVVAGLADFGFTLRIPGEDGRG